MELDVLLKELDENLNINRVEKSGKALYIYCEVNCTVAKCKYCGMESSSIHSRYIRTISDLPIQDYQVKLVTQLSQHKSLNNAWINNGWDIIQLLTLFFSISVISADTIAAISVNRDISS